MVSVTLLEFVSFASFVGETKKRKACLGNAVRVSSEITEQIGRSTRGILDRARGSRGVSIHLISVGVGESISVQKIWEGTHVGVGEVEIVSTRSDVRSVCLRRETLL